MITIEHFINEVGEIKAIKELLLRCLRHKDSIEIEYFLPLFRQLYTRYSKNIRNLLTAICKPKPVLLLLMGF